MDRMPAAGPPIVLCRLLVARDLVRAHGVIWLLLQPRYRRQGRGA
jgi:hypothetical protein